MPARAPYADLHMHSTASDGALEPEALVETAAGLGIRALALTDHDTVRGVARAQQAGRDRGVEVITGCELTAYVGDVELHLLAYFFSLDPANALLKLLEAFRARRRARALEMGARLRAAGVQVADRDILEAAGTADSIGQPHVAMALVNRGHAPNVDTAIRQYLREGRPGHVAKLQLSPQEVIRAVHDSGGLALLAHPGLEPHDELIAPLFLAGLDGLEAHYPAHAEPIRRFYAALARRHGLVVCGGSDFHGKPFKPDVLIGAAGLTRAELRELRRRAADTQLTVRPRPRPAPPVRPP